MATDLTQDAVLRFLRSGGGAVRNAALLRHFRSFLRESSAAPRHRERFKGFVNAVATVQRREDGAYVVLRKRFREPGAASAARGSRPEEEEPVAPPAPPGDVSGVVLPSAQIVQSGGGGSAETHLNPAGPPHASSPQAPQHAQRLGRGGEPAPPPPISGGTPSSPGSRQDVPRRPPELTERGRYTFADAKLGRSGGEPAGARQKRSRSPLLGGDPGPSGGLQAAAGGRPHPETGGGGSDGRRSEAGPPAPAHVAAPSDLHPIQGVHVARRRARHRKSYKTAISQDEDDEDDEDEEEQKKEVKGDQVPRRPESARGAARPLDGSIEHTGRTVSTSSPSTSSPSPPSLTPSSPSLTPSTPSSPSFASPPSAAEDRRSEDRGGSSPASQPGPPPTIYVQETGARGSPAPGPGRESGVGAGPGWNLSPGPRLSSGPGSLLPPSPADLLSSDWTPSGSPAGLGWNSSDEDGALTFPSAQKMGGASIQEVLRRSSDNRLPSLMHRAQRGTMSPWRHSTGHLMESEEEAPPSSTSCSPWHHSTGHLLDDREEAESSGGSTSSPLPRQRPAVARRVSGRLRSRKCRSLGAGLDQPFPDEGGGGAVSARQSRLLLLSSSLSLRYNLSSSSLSSASTSTSRCPSLRDLAELEEEAGPGGSGRKSGGKKFLPPQDLHKQSLVPLEYREHTWLVKGAAGAWTDIYSLFREDPSLLNRHDFISGYTVLHWIAKHGDHRVLNTLWYGVSKAGLVLDVDARSSCGYTPLHLAAMHGRKKMMRLLVHKFNANIGLRDAAGRKPWQVLEPPRAVDLLRLLGAPSPATLTQGRDGSPASHRHASFSSPERPHRSRPATGGMSADVKRSSSIAAFLKHKSLLRFHGHQADNSV